MIPKERAAVIEKYLQSGKEIVEFKPPLFLEEWEELMECQEKVAKMKGREKSEAEAFGIIPGEKVGEKKETEQPEKPKKSKKKD